MWRAAVKMAYDGQDFMGSQRQPEERTVEGEVLRALQKIEAIEDAEQNRFRVASRTDRGVSALGNVFCIDTSFDRRHLLHALNAQSEDVYFHSWAEVPFDFSPRRARQRWYRYFQAADGIDVRRFQTCAQLFVGKHDFKRFCKPEGRSTNRVIDSIDVLPLGDLLVIDLRAREFLRNMVRRMVAAMIEVGNGRSKSEEVIKALEGKECNFGLAPAENLTLMDIAYDLPFQVLNTPPYRQKVEERWREARLQLFFFDSLLRPEEIVDRD